MSMGKYAAFYGSIGFALMQIVGIHQEHDFAIVDEKSYRGWKLLDDFVDESCETFVDRNGQERTRRKANFQDKHHHWSVISINCAHPSFQKKQTWCFIEEIQQDDQILSHSKISIEEFQHYIELRA